MQSGEELLQSYESRAIPWKQMFLFSLSLALEFIADCERNDLRLLGLDAFEPPKGESIRCRLEDCLDVSVNEYWDYSVEELCHVVREFVSERPGLLFEFLVDD